MRFSTVTRTDVAGEVVEVGQGVKNFKAGDKVLITLNHAVSASIKYDFRYDNTKQWSGNYLNSCFSAGYKLIIRHLI